MPGPTSQSLSRPSMAAGTSPHCSTRLPHRKARFDQSLSPSIPDRRTASLDALRARGVRISSVRPADFNHGATRNEALQSVDTEFAVLIVQDALPDSSRWFEALVGPLVVDPSLAGTWARQMPRQDASRIIEYSLSNWLGSASAPRTVGPISAAELAALTPGERYEACAFDNVCSCIRMSVWRGHPLSAHSLRRRSRMGNTGATRRPSAEFRARGRRPAFTRAIRLVRTGAHLRGSPADLFALRAHDGADRKRSRARNLFNAADAHQDRSR